MFLLTLIARSTALHNNSIFLESVLQLLKLQLAHKNASTTRKLELCEELEKEFLREVEAFRPCFTLAASLEVADQYTTRLYRALHYFGLYDDPLTRQLDLIVGRNSMVTSNKYFNQTSFTQGTFRRVGKRDGEQQQAHYNNNQSKEYAEESSESKKNKQIQSSKVKRSCINELSNEHLHETNRKSESLYDILFNNNADQVLPEELPNPPRVDVNASKRKNALKMPLQYRGHWVLQEPDIAITREERREDPWEAQSFIVNIYKYL